MANRYSESLACVLSFMRYFLSERTSIVSTESSRYFEAERSGRLKIEDELEFRCLLDRKIGGIGTLENSRGVVEGHGDQQRDPSD
jgi:hypothetical protein